jgi:hypothetical protein
LIQKILISSADHVILALFIDYFQLSFQEKDYQKEENHMITDIINLNLLKKDLRLMVNNYNL